ncbi:putative TPR repeat methyltransferase [Bradyrhizobium sp. LM6.11]
MQDAVADIGLKPDELVVDIGSNDGTLLSGFKRRGMRVLGIEPTNIGRIAQEQGIDTLQAFFDEETARKVVETHGHAKVATATNVFAHVAQLGSFIRGLERLLAPDGVFILENHYLLDVIEGGQFDTIYHEHLRTYSLKSIVKLFEFFDFTCVDAQRVSRYGGNNPRVRGEGQGASGQARGRSTPEGRG